MDNKLYKDDEERCLSEYVVKTTALSESGSQIQSVVNLNSGSSHTCAGTVSLHFRHESLTDKSLIGLASPCGANDTTLNEAISNSAAESSHMFSDVELLDVRQLDDNVQLAASVTRQPSCVERSTSSEANKASAAAPATLALSISDSSKSHSHQVSNECRKRAEQRKGSSTSVKLKLTSETDPHTGRTISVKKNETRRHRVFDGTRSCNGTELATVDNKTSDTGEEHVVRSYREKNRQKCRIRRVQVEFLENSLNEDYQMLHTYPTQPASQTCRI